MRLKWIAGLLVLTILLALIGLSNVSFEAGEGASVAAKSLNAPTAPPEPQNLSPERSDEPIVVDNAASPTKASPQFDDPPFSFQVEAALSGSDGQAAMKAVYDMERCESMDKMLADVFRMRDETKDPKLRRGYVLVAEALSKEQRSCQTLSAYHKSRRGDLLKIANAQGVPGAALKYLTQSNEVVDSDINAKNQAIKNLQADAWAGSRHAIFILGIEGENYQLPPETRWAFASAAAWIQKNDGSGFTQIDDFLIMAQEMASYPPGTPDDVAKRVNAAAKQLIQAYLAARKNRDPSLPPLKPPSQ